MLQNMQIYANRIEIEKRISVEGFNKYILSKENLKSTSSLAYKCELSNTYCRWNLWRTFLKAIPDTNEAEMRKSVKTSRDFYKEKLDSFVNVRAKKLELDDPLSRGTSVLNTENGKL